MKIKNEINNIHDKSYKDLFSNKEVFINMIEGFVKKIWGKHINKDNLVLVNKTYILSDYEELESDIVYKAKINDSEIIFYILLEFQSSVDYSMPIRLFLYMAEIYREILKNTEKNDVKKKNFRLPAIVPIVLYNGEYRWSAEKNFKDIIESKELFGNNIIDFEYILLDINRYEKNELVNLGDITAAIFLLDQKVEVEEFVHRAITIGRQFNKLKEEDKMLLKHWIRNSVSDELKNIIGENLENIFDMSEKEVEKMTANISKTIKETLENTKLEGKIEGIREGKIEGIREGKREGKEEMVKKMLIRGDSIQDIAEITEFTVDEIEEIRKRMIN